MLAFEQLVNLNTSTIGFTLVNTLIVFVLFRVFLYKPVTNMLEQRKTAISAELDAARDAKEKASSAEKEYLERLAKSKEEAAELVAEAAKKAELRGDEIVTEAKKNAEQLVAKANENIEHERKCTINEIKNQISELVILAASAVTEKEISASDHDKLIGTFLAKVGD